MKAYTYSWQNFYLAVRSSGFHLVFVFANIVLFLLVDQVIDMVNQISKQGEWVSLALFGYGVSNLFFGLVIWFTLRLIFDLKTLQANQASDASANTTLPLFSLLKYVTNKYASADRKRYFAGNWGLIFPRNVAVLQSLAIALVCIYKGWWNVALYTLISGVAVLLIVFYRSKSMRIPIIKQPGFWFFSLFSLYITSAFLAVFFQAFYIQIFYGLNLILAGLAGLLFGYILSLYLFFDSLNALFIKFKFRRFEGIFTKPYPILLPIILIPLIMGGLVGSDNHQIRLLSEDNGPMVNSRFNSVKDAVNDFSQMRANQLSFPSKGKNVVPVFFVASQGGGLRAAYWSALSLLMLEERVPMFEHNVFSLSGASGGTVGNVFYLASQQFSEDYMSALIRYTIEREPDVGGQQQCANLRRLKHNKTRQEMCLLANALGQDYLSSVAASFLYNDLMYRYLPIPLQPYAQDRATYLEKAFEQHFEKVYRFKDIEKGGNWAFGLNRPYNELYSKENEKQWTPILLGTTTVQELGMQALYAPFRINTNEFINTLDLRTMINTHPSQWRSDELNITRDMRLSTVALNSARFPYITPTGTINSEAPRAQKFHVADAGYYDNYGSSSTLSMIKAFMANNKDEDTIYVPIPVILKNDKWQDKYNPSSKSPVDTNFPSINANASSIWGHELLSPIQALIEIRGGLANTRLLELIAFQKQYQSLVHEHILNNPHASAKALSSVLLDNNAIIFINYNKAEDGRMDPPLGWWLSNESQEEMLEQILHYDFTAASQ